MSARDAFRDWILAQEGKPYVWAGKGQRVVVGTGSVPVFDCSGLITCGMVQAGWPATCPACGEDWTLMHGAQALFDHLEALDMPRPLDLAFYGSGPTHIVHVMVCMAGIDGRVFGATGGNSDVTSPEVAARFGARVRFRPRITYRPDFVGLRKLPL